MLRSRRWMRIPLAGVLLLSGYVLSVGPASVIADRHPVLREYLELYYAPLILIGRQTPLGWPLGVYEQWWRQSFR
jgi:hypothetical protein